MKTVGRWSLFRREEVDSPGPEFIARQLLHRTGVVFRRTIEREKQPIPWRDLHRVFRRLEISELRKAKLESTPDSQSETAPALAD